MSFSNPPPLRLLSNEIIYITMSYIFKIGQEVVCVRVGSINSLPGVNPTLVYGNTYIVKDILFCTKCGLQKIDVGVLNVIGSLQSYCSCGIIYNNPNPSIHWCASSRFVPLEEFKQSETALTELLNEIKIEI